MEKEENQKLILNSPIAVQKTTITESQKLVSAPITEPIKNLVTETVSLLQEKDIIRVFFRFINEGNPSDAVMMMTSNIVGDDSLKQAYGVQFNAINSVIVKNIEESSKADWTESKHQYMVTLDTVMDPSSANGPIPYYGFELGENIRFINLIKEDGQWRIDGLLTGP